MGLINTAYKSRISEKNVFACICVASTIVTATGAPESKVTALFYIQHRFIPSHPAFRYSRHPGKHTFVAQH